MDLRNRVITSTAWYVTTRLAIQGLSWTATIIVARWLSPRDYGLFTMALTVVTALELFQELGLGTAIVQRQDLTQEEVNTIFWIVSGVSCTLVAALLVGANAAAHFYGEPRLAGMIRLLSAAVFFNSLGLVPYNLLTKEIDFRRRSLAETAGVITSSSVTVVAAYFGYGVLALISGYLARTVVRNAALWAAGRWMPGVKVSRQRLRGLLTFSLHVAGSSALRTLYPIVNKAIIGRTLGGIQLGLFAVSEAIAMGPHGVSSAVVQQLSLPVFAKLQRDEGQLRRYFLKITKYLAVMIFPIQVGMMLVADDAVSVVLSERWEAAVGLLRALCVVGVFYALPSPSGPLLVARGKADTLLKVNSMLAVSMAGAILLGSQFGLGGVAAAWVVVFSIFRLRLLLLSLSEIGIPTARYVEHIRPALVAAGMMVIPVLAVRVLGGFDAGGIDRLVASVIVGAAVYVTALLSVDRPLGAELRGMVQQLLAGSRA